MNTAAASDSTLAEFAGEARCFRVGPQLHISGTERGSALPLRVVFAGVGATALPERLQQPRLQTAASGWQLSAGVASYAIAARGVQVLRDVSSLTASALPGAAPSWRGRMGWALLLNILRIPGAAGALKLLRGR